MYFFIVEPILWLHFDFIPLTLIIFWNSFLLYFTTFNSLFVFLLFIVNYFDFALNYSWYLFERSLCTSYHFLSFDDTFFSLSAYSSCDSLSSIARAFFVYSFTELVISCSSHSVFTPVVCFLFNSYHACINSFALFIFRKKRA